MAPSVGYVEVHRTVARCRAALGGSLLVAIFRSISVIETFISHATIRTRDKCLDVRQQEGTEMNLESVGILAEVIAATAVVVSLVYLAFQIRDSANQNTVNRSAILLDEFNRMQEVLISSPEVVNLFTKMKANEALLPLEDTLLEIVSNRFLAHWNSIQIAHNRKVLDEEIYPMFCEDVKRYVNGYPQMHKKFLEITSFYTHARGILILAPIFEEKPEFSDNENAA